jgi:arylsulfatase A-like enzyme
MQKQSSYFTTVLLFLIAGILTRLVEGVKHNVIIYMTDDQGFNVMPGNTKIALSNLERFASQGKKLQRTYTTSLCAPSRWAAYTGSNEILANGYDSSSPIPAVTLPKAMRTLGYNTAIIGKYGYGNNSTISAANKMGFTYSYIYPTHVDAHFTFPVTLEENGKVITFPQNRKANTARCLVNKCVFAPDLFHDKAMQYISEQAKLNHPFFLVWAPNLPHVGKFISNPRIISCPVPTYGNYRKLHGWTAGQKGYASMMTNYIDRDIGALMDKLENLTLADNTYVLYYSDNGNEPSLLRTNRFFMANYPLRDGKGSQYEGGIRVPAVIWGPGRIPAGSSSNYFFHTQDLLPTITELVGNKITKDTSSSSAASIWLHGDPKTVDSTVKPILIELCPDNVSNSRCTYAFISLKEWPTRAFKMLNNGKGTEVYDVISDPSETKNLIKDSRFNNSIVALQNEKAAFKMSMH